MNHKNHVASGDSSRKENFHLRLLIADDEKNICRGLSEKIDWASMNIEVIGLAENGEEAYALYVEHKPELVIADINMPKMDGLELLKKLHAEDPSVLVIFISAYSKFSYAQEALKHGAFDYVIKPFAEQDLIDTVQRGVETIQKQHSQKKLLHHASAVQQKYNKKAIIDILCGFEPSGSRLIDVLRNVSPSVLHYRLCTGMLVALSPSGTLPSEVLSRLQTLQMDGLHSVYLETGRDELLALYFYDDPSLFRKHMGSLCVCINSVPCSFPSDRLCVGVSSEFPTEKITPRLYAECSFASIEACGRTDLFSCSYPQAFSALSGQTPEMDMEQFSNSIFHAVQDADRSQITDSFVNLFHFLGYVKQTPNILDFNLNLFSYLLHFLRKLDQKMHAGLSAELSEKINFIRNLSLKTRSFRFYHLCLSVILEIYTALNSMPLPKTGGIIQAALKYIAKNYASNFTLAGLAAELYVSPAHLSRLFKIELNETFSNYLTTYRIEMAKQLLRSGDRKIYEIADSVGFSDSQYFAKTFKKIVGVTPTEYMNSLFD